MFLAVGTTAYVAGIFHLMTHAFFKALLFLGAGSVIHGMSDEQDMHRMGGLFRRMPVTAVTMAIGSAPRRATPSRRVLVEGRDPRGRLRRGGWYAVLWLIGLVTAMITAFYIARLWVLVFLGEPRWEEGEHPHESPRIMTIPLMVLAGALGGRRADQHPVPADPGAVPGTQLRRHRCTHPRARPCSSFWPVCRYSPLSPGSEQPSSHGATGRWRRFEQGFEPLWGTWERRTGSTTSTGRSWSRRGGRVPMAAAFGFDLPVIDGAVNGVGRLVRGLGTGPGRCRPDSSATTG